MTKIEDSHRDAVPPLSASVETSRDRSLISAKDVNAQWNRKTLACGSNDSSTKIIVWTTRLTRTILRE